jgi:hypothetical protein
LAVNNDVYFASFCYLFAADCFHYPVPFVLLYFLTSYGIQYN